MRIVTITTLPDLNSLAAAAAAEGHNIVAKLLAEWATGAHRFDGPGEALLAAVVDGEVVAIGGITREPNDPTAMRMRRFYVHPGYRRRGIAGALVRTLVDACERRGLTITVHAGVPDAAPFWEAQGFGPVANQPYSHVLKRAP